MCPLNCCDPFSLKLTHFDLSKSVIIPQDKPSGIPGPTSTSSGKISAALSTITNSPKKTAVPAVKGLKKIPAPSKPHFSPELPKTKAATASTTSMDRLRQSREKVNECKQS